MKGIDGRSVNFNKASGKWAITNVLELMRPSMPIDLWLGLIKANKEVVIYFKREGNAERMQIILRDEEEKENSIT